MSSLWTPDGERPLRREPATAPEEERERASDAEVEAQLEALRQQLAAAPADAVVANHAYGLFELAAVHLSTSPPQLDQARLAIDALGALVEGLGGRLGEAQASLADGLAQLRMAYLEVAKLPAVPDGPPA